MNLYLKTKTELVPDELLIQSTRIEVTSNILEELFDENYDYNLVIVTKRYVDMYGDLVAKSLKALYYLNSAKIIYITYSDAYDPFSKSIIECNPAIIKMELKELTLEVLNKLRYIVTELDLEDFTDESIERCRRLINEYEGLVTQSKKAEYIETHSQDLIDVSKILLKSGFERESLSNKVTLLKKELELAESRNKKHIKDKLNLININKNIKSKLESWENKYISNMDRIERFNERIFKGDNAPVECSGLNKPIVIYFKQLEDISFDRMFNELYQSLDREGNYCKAIIYDENYINDYSKLGFKLIGDSNKIKDISTIDKVVRNSDIRPLVKEFIKEIFRVNVLLVLDKTCEIDPKISGDNVNIFYLGKYRDNYKEVEIDDYSFISPYEGDWKSVKRLLIDRADNRVSELSYSITAHNNELFDTIKKLIDDKFS